MLTQLRLKGVRTDDHEERSSVPASFVVEIFELQEQVQESESLEFLDKAAHSIAARQAELRGDFQKCYGQGDYGEASSVIAKYKYYESTLESIIRKKAFLVLHNEEPSKKESVAGHV